MCEYNGQVIYTSDTKLNIAIRQTDEGMDGYVKGEDQYHLELFSDHFPKEVSFRSSVVDFQYEDGKGRARAGFWQRGDRTRAQVIKPYTVYMVSFFFRTTGSGERQVGIWWPSNPDLFDGEDYRIPGTGGSWHRFVALVWYRDAMPMISPLLRSWGNGAVYFDDVKIMEVRIPESIMLPPSPIVEILPKGSK